jgi:putative FmdB family regulatory protein
MPTYSYICDGCGKSFELEQRITEDPIKKCVLCGKSEARRQIVSANFILKGGGWYSDGYGSSSKAKVSASGTDSSSSSSSSGAPASASSESSAKTDTAAKPDTSPKPETTKPKATAAG